METTRLCESILIKKARKGDEDAFCCLYKEYRWLIQTTASPYFLPGAENEDLIQEGLIGFLEAIRDYKEEENMNFLGFARLCVSRQIITALKAYTTKKHLPLNNYKSIFEPIYHEGETTLEEKLSLYAIDPEKQLIEKEAWLNIMNYAETNFSELENKIFKLYLSGESYRSIAERLNTTRKAVDCAVWRIKMKCRNHGEISNVI